MAGHWSLRLYRALLRAYPRAFRRRFAADLEADFLQIAATRGWRAAWRKTIGDLVRAVPLAHGGNARNAGAATASPDRSLL